MYELSAPIFPGGPPKAPFKTVTHDKTSLKNRNFAIGLSPFSQKTSARQAQDRSTLPSSLPNKSKLINQNSSVDDSMNGP